MKVVISAVLAFCAFSSARRIEDPSNNLHGKFLFQDSCGIAKGRQKRVTNGTNLVYGTEPWLVNLYKRSKGSFSCGGTLISDSWVLSAAHCTANDAEDLHVAVGDHSVRTVYNSTEENDFHKIFEKDSNEVIHEVEALHYVNDVLDSDLDDIVLIKLKNKVAFNAHTEPACLPANGDFIPEIRSDQGCKVMGWGQLEDGYWPYYAETADVNIFTVDECMENARSWVSRVPKQYFCAGHYDQNTGGCLGDSGSPLMCQNNGVSVVQGVTSGFKDKNHDSECTKANVPAAYANVGYYIEWIHNVTGMPWVTDRNDIKTAIFELED